MTCHTSLINLPLHLCRMKLTTWVWWTLITIGRCKAIYTLNKRSVVFSGYDITEILLKVALNTITLTPQWEIHCIETIKNILFYTLGLPFLASEASLSECLICGQVFIDKSTRKLHMKEHPTYQKYKCHICDHLYSSLSSLNRHTLIHMGVKPYVCHVCHKNFTDKSNLKVHLKLHTGKSI